MNAFWNGFGFGFASGMMNNMFGCCRPFGFGGFGWGMPMFGAPMMGFWGGGCCCPSIFTPMPMPFVTMGYMPTYYDSFERTSYTGTGDYSTKVKEVEETKTKKTKDPETEEPALVSKISQEAQKLYDKWIVKDGVNKKDLSPQFCEKVIEICKDPEVNCKPNDLMAIIYVESRFNHGKEVTKRTDDKKPEVGLIQFTHSDRNSEDDEYGITIEKILGMSAIEQLDLVKDRILKYRKDNSIDKNTQLTLDNLAEMICHEANEYDKNRAGTEVTGKIYATKGTRSYNKNSDFDMPEDRTVINQKTNAEMTETSKDNVITLEELRNGLKEVIKNK